MAVVEPNCVTQKKRQLIMVAILDFAAVLLMSVTGILQLIPMQLLQLHQLQQLVCYPIIRAKK